MSEGSHTAQVAVKIASATIALGMLGCLVSQLEVRRKQPKALRIVGAAPSDQWPSHNRDFEYDWTHYRFGDMHRIQNHPMAHKFDEALDHTVRIGVVGPRAAGKSALIWNMLALLGNDLSSEPISIRPNVSAQEFVACKQLGNLSSFLASQEYVETQGIYRLPDMDHNISKFKICLVDTPGFRIDAPAAAAAFECVRIFQGCYKDCEGNETIPLYPGEGMTRRAKAPGGEAPFGGVFQATIKDYLVHTPQSLLFDPVRVPFSRSQYAMDILLVVAQLDPATVNERMAAKAAGARWNAIKTAVGRAAVGRAAVGRAAVGRAALVGNIGHRESNVVPAVHVLTHVDCLLEQSPGDDFDQLKRTVDADCILGAISYRTTAHGGQVPRGLGAPDAEKYLQILHRCLLTAEQAWLERRIM